MECAEKAIPGTCVMGKKISKQELNGKRLETFLINEYNRWNELFLHGGADPFWEDGCNLNLVRNHIIWYKYRMQEELEQMPECYSWEIPPIVPQKYMADPDGIRRDASQSLRKVMDHPDFAYLESYGLSHVIDKEKEKRVSTVKYVYALRDALRDDDLLYARRYRDPERLLELLHNSRCELENMTPGEKVLPDGQLTIFDILGNL